MWNVYNIYHRNIAWYGGPDRLRLWMLFESQCYSLRSIEGTVWLHCWCIGVAAVLRWTSNVFRHHWGLHQHRASVGTIVLMLGWCWSQTSLLSKMLLIFCINPLIPSVQWIWYNTLSQRCRLALWTRSSQVKNVSWEPVRAHWDPIVEIRR